MDGQSACRVRLGKFFILFAVGTVVTDRPPLRSTRAELSHVAPTLSIWRQRNQPHAVERL